MKKFMKTKILLLSFLSCYSISAEYYLKLDDKATDRYIVNIEFDQAGFDSNGIHRVTGTEYDEEGYNQQGFNVSGLGREECRERDSDNYASHHYLYNYYSIYRWDGEQAPSNSGNLYFTHIDLRDMYRYRVNYVNGSDRVGSYNRADICRSSVTRDYVIGRTSHPNISIGGDFWNWEDWED